MRCARRKIKCSRLLGDRVSSTADYSLDSTAYYSLEEASDGKSVRQFLQICRPLRIERLQAPIRLIIEGGKENKEKINSQPARNPRFFFPLLLETKPASPN